MGRPLVLALRGEIDIAVATSLRPGWYALAEQERLDEIVVDLREVTFMDAAGLGLLVGMRNRQRRHGGDLRLCNAPGQVVMLLRLTGLSAAFPDADLPCDRDDPHVVDVRDATGLAAMP
jgi:anti-sigma B factor antagonist